MEIAYPCILASILASILAFIFASILAFILAINARAYLQEYQNRIIVA